MCNRFIFPCICLVSSLAANVSVVAKPPNFVLIVADDLGYGDLGCYGGTTKTPNLDRLAQEGIRFTDFHSNGPMCSATRAALLTGLYQNRFGREFEGALGKDPHLGLPLAAVTLPELLQPDGYATGIFGKWHLGNRPPLFPTRQGFDEFRGLVTGDGDHFSHIDREGNEDWWNGEKIEMEKGYTTELLTKHSIDFIQRHRNRPFFLYVPHLAIHFPWQGPEDPLQRRQGVDYGDDKWGTIPDRKNIARHVKSMTEALDRSVGDIIATLKQLKLDQDTFVFFMSDNGGYIKYSGGFENISSNGPLRGQKAELYEGGHRVPAMAWWPSRIMPSVCDQTVLSFDLLPTVLRIASVTSHVGDGVDVGDLLFRGKPLAERAIFWRKADVRAVREGVWKLVVPGNERQKELYHLGQDLGESRNLAAIYPDRVNVLFEKLIAWEKSVDRSASQ